MWETHREEWYAWQDELLWASGLFEGEGCFTISGTQARVKLNSTDEDVVLRFHEAVLGIGQVRVEDSHLARGHQRQWEWFCGKQLDVLILIELLVPHLGHRRTGRARQLEQHIHAQLERKLERHRRRAA